MAQPVDVAVRVEGLKELRRDLRGVEKALPRELTKTLKEAASPVADKAKALAPRGSGRLAASIRPYASGTAVTVATRLPYGDVIHWGGTTGRGHRPGVGGSGSVKVAGSRFVERAAVDREDETAERLGDGIEELLGRNGFK